MIWTPEGIKALRTSLGLTQRQFAERLGVHPMAVHYWETGKRSPTGLYLKALDALCPDCGEHHHDCRCERIGGL